MALMAKRWSDSSGAFFLTSITFPNDPSPKILIGWKLSIETFGSTVLPLFSVWPETQSFNVLLRHRILYSIYIYIYVTIEALSARGAYPTFSWFLAIAVNAQNLFVKYLTIFIFIWTQHLEVIYIYFLTDML
jgi:hypothetical protein